MKPVHHQFRDWLIEHKQSVVALRHVDYNDPTSYSYEQAMDTIKRISVSANDDLEQQLPAHCL
jgi:hypothetical protein